MQKQDSGLLHYITSDTCLSLGLGIVPNILNALGGIELMIL